MDTNPNLQKVVNPEVKQTKEPTPIRDEKDAPRTIQGTATPTIKKG